MGDSAAVTDHVEAFVSGLKMIVHFHFHVIEFHLNAVQEGIVIGCTRCDAVKGVDHLDDAVEYAFRQHEGEVAGLGLERGAHEGLLDSLLVAPASADQVAEALDYHAAAEHVRESCDAFSVAVGVLEGLCEVLGDQEGEVGVLCPLGGVLEAVAVDGDNPVGVLVDDDAVGIHAEGAHVVLELLGAVDDLALIELVRQRCEHLGGKLDAHADVHAVGEGLDVQVLADLLDPFAAAAADGDYALCALV